MAVPKKKTSKAKILYRCNKLSSDFCISFRYYHSTISKI